MKKRHHFIKMVLGLIAGMGFLLNPIAAGWRLVWAKAKKIMLLKGTRVETLIGKNPANLDTKNLDLTPLEAFQTMGQKDYHVNLSKWRLEIDAQVQHPLKLTYDHIKQMPFTILVLTEPDNIRTAMICSIRNFLLGMRVTREPQY